VSQKFSLGTLVITPAALEALPREDVVAAIRRHACGDWGDLEADDRRVNEDALKEGARLFSAYTSRQGTRFYVITEWDRSVTTVLLPEDY
jgi:hypothetical protein